MTPKCGPESQYSHCLSIGVVNRTNEALFVRNARCEQLSTIPTVNTRLISEFANGSPASDRIAA